MAHSANHELHFYLAHVASSKANDLGARPSRRNIFGCGLCLLNISAQDEGIRAESNQGSGLHAANGSRAAGDEYDLALCQQSAVSHASLAISRAGESLKRGQGCSLKMSSRHTALRYLDSGTDMIATRLLLTEVVEDKDKTEGVWAEGSE